jgi:phosphatidylethanolamine/phosphatidyl-N-methylethanolamine N-methyltransferase
MGDRLSRLLAHAQPLGERAWRAVQGERVGAVAAPAVLDAAAAHVSAALSSAYFPVHLHNVDLADVALSRAIVAIAAAPVIWNAVARAEHHTRAISRVVGRTLGAYGLALWIFSFSLYRDLLFVAALEAQPKLPYLGEPRWVLLGALLYATGGVLVATSMWRLGVTGTYLGDYFGILMDARVEAFPYSMFDSPMYDGATLCFMGKSILYVCTAPAGGWRGAGESRSTLTLAPLPLSSPAMQGGEPGRRSAVRLGLPRLPIGRGVRTVRGAAARAPLWHERSPPTARARDSNALLGLPSRRPFTSQIYATHEASTAAAAVEAKKAK